MWARVVSELWLVYYFGYIGFFRGCVYLILRIVHYILSYLALFVFTVLPLGIRIIKTKRSRKVSKANKPYFILNEKQIRMIPFGYLTPNFSFFIRTPKVDAEKAKTGEV